jgi:hypothetical protein
MEGVWISSELATSIQWDFDSAQLQIGDQWARLWPILRVNACECRATEDNSSVWAELNREYRQDWVFLFSYISRRGVSRYDHWVKGTQNARR